MPVASIATCVHSFSASHFDKRRRSAVVVWKVRTSVVTWPSETRAGRPPPSPCERRDRNIADASTPSSPPLLRRRRGAPYIRILRSVLPSQDGSWQQSEVLPEPRVQLGNGLNRTKVTPTSVPTTPHASKVSCAVDRHRRWGTIMRRGRTWPWIRMRPFRAPQRGRGYSLPTNPRWIASRICPDLI